MNQSTIDNIFIKGIFDSLLNGGGSILTPENINAINVVALRLYSIEKLEDKDDIDCLKYLLMICNALYNRTDMEILPIEDGFYDLLLEKYKEYDSEFQVGSAVIEFQSTVESSRDRKIISPVYIIKDKHEPKNEVAQEVYDNIMKPKLGKMDRRDFNISPVYPIYDDLSKRTHNTEHAHPDLVGTLDKCKFVFLQDAINAGADKDPNVKILERDFFGKHIQDGIIDPNQEIEVVLELKYDGISVEADCSNVVVSARTRGDTGIGVASDITPILYQYPFSHAKSMIGQKPIGVKFEAIMTKTALSMFSQAKEYNYINCRTAIIGLFGSSDGPKYRDYITLVPLEVDRHDVPSINNRVTEIEFLNELFRSNGEPLRYCTVKGTLPKVLFYIKTFLEEAKEAREYLNFMYDGIVVSYLDEDIRHRLGRENHINKYSMAVKFDPLCKTTTFRGYTYEVGQNGDITPMIHYDPVEFLGSIHTKSTGSSLKRFNDLALKYGDHIDVTYRNDVMPYVTKPDYEYNRNNPNPVIEPPEFCPVCGHKLSISDSGKSLICTNWHCDGRTISRAANMLAKLNLKGFGQQMVRAIGKYTLSEMVQLDFDYLAPRIGEGNAANFLEIMNRLKTEPIMDYQIMGSLGFSGISTKKWKDVMQYYSMMDLIEIYDNITHDIGTYLYGDNVVGPKTGEVISDEFPLFIDDIEWLATHLSNIVETKGKQAGGKQIRFSGCRDLQLEEQLCKSGHDADSKSSVTKKTDILIVPYQSYSSNKTKTMEKYSYGKIVALDEFKSNTNFYLS